MNPRHLSLAALFAHFAFAAPAPAQQTWNSQPGKLYDLLGSTTLDTPPSTPWAVYADGVTITTDLDTDTVTIPRPANPRYFFSLREKDAPTPLPLETFEGGTIPAGWQAIDNADTGNTLWQVGNPATGPSGGPPTGADSYHDDAN